MFIRIGTFVGHKGAVWQARISSDATLAVTGSADFTALVLPLRRPNQPWFDWKLTTTLALYRKVWDTHTGENLHTFQHAHIVRAVALPSQPRPSIVATGGAEKKLRIFDLSAASRPASPNSSLPNGSAVTNGHVNGVSDKSAASYEIGPGVHGGTIKSIVWTSDPNVLVTAADDKKIRWWDLRSRSLICEFELDGVVGSCELNAAATVNPPSTASLLAEAANPTSGINGVNGSHGGINGTDRAASGGGPVLSVAAGKRVYFFDGLEPNRLAKTFEMPYEVASVALHPDQQRFVTGCSGDTWVRMHDFEDGKELGAFCSLSHCCSPRSFS